MIVYHENYWCVLMFMHPGSNSCRAVAWAQNVTWVLGTIAYAGTSGLFLNDPR